MSPTRKRYFAKLVGRCIVLVLCAILCAVSPEKFEILDGANFFHRLSSLHFLWAIWMVDMMLQIIPVKNAVPLGSQKLFALRFRMISYSYPSFAGTIATSVFSPMRTESIRMA